MLNSKTPNSELRDIKTPHRAKGIWNYLLFFPCEMLIYTILLCKLKPKFGTEKRPDNILDVARFSEV